MSDSKHWHKLDPHKKVSSDWHQIVHDRTMELIKITTQASKMPLTRNHPIEACLDFSHKNVLITVMRGKRFEKMGYSVRDQHYLYPEETLYLAESGGLILRASDKILSIQQIYQYLFELWNLDYKTYAVYKYLKKKGLIVRPVKTINELHDDRTFLPAGSAQNSTEIQLLLTSHLEFQISPNITHNPHSAASDSVGVKNDSQVTTLYDVWKIGPDNCWSKKKHPPISFRVLSLNNQITSWSNLKELYYTVLESAKSDMALKLAIPSHGFSVQMLDMWIPFQESISPQTHHDT